MRLARYTAACVRACALRSALLGPEDWQRLAGMADMADTSAILDWLKTRGALDDGVADVLAAERAAHEAVIRNASGLLRFSHGALAELLRCFVRYYDLLNIEAVVHRVHAYPDEATRPQGRFYDTGPFGLLRPATLAAVTNYPALGHTLRHSSFATPFDAALQRYREDEDAAGFVEQIEFAFFAHWVAAAERCGTRLRDAAHASPLGVFFVARAVGAAARLKLHRQAETSRAAKWLSLVAPQHRVEACLALCSGDGPSVSVRELLAAVLPAAKTEQTPATPGPRGEWGLLDTIVMEAALKATRGIAFDADFLTGFLLRQMCQARELTVLLESRETNQPVPSPAEGGNTA